MHREPRPRRRVVGWVIAAVVVVLLAWVSWVTVRALLARDQLLSAVPIVQSIEKNAASGHLETVAADLRTVRRHADAAASLTSDPLWRAAEVVPWAGPNLTAFRQAAAVVDSMSHNALPPLVDLASTIKVDDFRPTDGTIDLAPIEHAAPKLETASVQMKAAVVEANRIDTSHTIPQIGNAVDQLTEVVDRIGSTVDALHTAVTLLPPMLGQDGPRHYLLLFQNNAELRSSGGIPGALAIVTADHGKLSLTAQAASGDVVQPSTPILPLTEVERTLYGNQPGEYIQDVNLVPDFARSGELASALLASTTGQQVDGVVGVDPVVLSELLKATGPVKLADGTQLTSGNAVKTLLSEVYSRYRVPKQEDAFFADAAARSFAALTSGSARPSELMTALTKGVSERRVLVWSAHEGEQKLLAPTALAGALPTSTADTSAFGVYYNDATGAKMDYYLRDTVGVESAVCRADGRVSLRVGVSLHSVAPADAATSLPPYVTGAGVYGVPPGTVRTQVTVYGPKGSIVVAASLNGEQVPIVSTVDDGRPIVQMFVDLTPGQTSALSVEVLAPKGTPLDAFVDRTPTAFPTTTRVGDAECSALGVRTPAPSPSP